MYNAFLNVSIKVPYKNGNPDDYDKEVLNQNIDIKKVINGDPSNFLASLIIKNILKQANFEVKFPLDEGHYEFVGIQIPGAMILASAKFSLSGELKWKTSKRKLVFGGSFQFYGKLN